MTGTDLLLRSFDDAFGDPGWAHGDDEVRRAALARAVSRAFEGRGRVPSPSAVEAALARRVRDRRIRALRRGGTPVGAVALRTGLSVRQVSRILRRR